MENDTTKLLRECNAGIKMGESAIKQVLPKAKDRELRRALEVTKNTHAELGDKTHQKLLQQGADTKDPHAIVRMMSDAKTKMVMMMNTSDSTIADLMTDGCNMGIKSLSRYLNRYSKADDEARELAKRLIASEEYLEGKLRNFL